MTTLIIPEVDKLLEEILTYQIGGQFPETEIHPKILEIINRLSPEDCKLVIGYIKGIIRACYEAVEDSYGDDL